MEATGRHLLGPHVVGQRVVIRRLLTGQVGPTGGPAMTDVLGVCESWQDGSVVVRREDGSAATFLIRDIVSGKPVPPRPPVHSRLSPREVHEIASTLFPDLEVEALGPWLLRSSAAFAQRRRPNSVLALTGPHPSVSAVTSWYAARGRRPIACVLPDSDEERLLLEHGWGPESTDADSLFMIGSIARAARLLGDPPSFAIELLDEGEQAYATFRDDASGRAVLSHDWVGLAGLEVTPDRRRHGIGLAMVATLLEWGAEQGARTAYLQVLADNTPALGLYERLGFTVHHRYRYLAP
jgi:ribosomal protein S18 acetylase RimI-like enzyme